MSEPIGVESGGGVLMLALATLMRGILSRLFDNLNRIADPVTLRV